jgi:CRISPR-associated exonuclease Cas4
VTDLKQFAYCPRIVYYHYCLPDIRPKTYKMQAAVEAHETAEEREARRSLKAYGLKAGERVFDLWLESSEVGLRGRIDLAIRTETEAIPVDYKDSPGRAGPHFIRQLAAYGLLLEENWHLPANRGFLYFIPARRARAYALTAEVKAEVRSMVAAIREMVERERMPPPVAERSKCAVCEFRRFCNDVDL